MSERREFNAPNVDTALERAASALELARDAITYEVLDEGSSGFLGLGARDARIVVEQPAEHEQPSPESPPPSPEPSELSKSSALPEAEEEVGQELGEASEGQEAAEPAQVGAVPEALLADVREQVENTLEAMAFEGSLELREEGEVISVNLESADAGLLIGQKGETLEALQYLINVALHRRHQDSKKVVLDCEGYRERRIKAVQGMAHRAAKRVTKEDKSVDLPPMNSSERRAVHDYLKENPMVNTSSSGNDESRRVTIAPTHS